MSFLIRQTLFFAIPLMTVALAGVFAERSGIINLALEGTMIFGVFMGVVFCRILQTAGLFEVAREAGNWQALQGYLLLALLFVAFSGAVFSLLLGVATISFSANQTIVGTAMNMLAPALALFLIRIMANQNVLPLKNGGSATFFMIRKENLGIESDGFFVETFVNKAYLTTYFCILVFIILSVILYKTRFGLRLRSCGENPQAAASLGINVFKMRYIGTMISGALAGVGGFAYSVTSANTSATGEVAGMGFLALAVMIFGNWKPLNIALASMLFGLFKCIGASYTVLDINGDGVFKLAELGISAHFYRLMPFLITLIVLMLTSKNSRAPKAEGQPYDKGMR